MNSIKEKCIIMKKMTDKIRKNLSTNLDDPIFRNNYLEFGIQSFERKEDQDLFRSLITFYDIDKFLLDYKQNNKDLKKIADIYHTDIQLVKFYIDVIKALQK